MTKDELRELVEFVNGAWNRDVYGEALQRQLKAWWTMLGDLDFATVRKVLTNQAMTGYLPRCGEIRVKALLGPLLDPYEAWADAQRLIQALQNGTAGVAVQPETMKTLQRLGDVAKGMATNGDRDMFISVFKKVQTEMIEQACALPV